MSNENESLNYRSPARTSEPVGIAFWALMLSFGEMVWFFPAVLTLYFLPPTWWHFYSYDHSAGRMGNFAFLALPSILGLVLGIVALARLQGSMRNRAGVVILATAAIVLSSLGAGWFFWHSVIDPANPRAPGYWL